MVYYFVLFFLFVFTSACFSCVCVCLFRCVCVSVIYFISVLFFLSLSIVNEFAIPFSPFCLSFYLLLSFSLFRRMRLLSISSLSTISLYLPTRSFDFVDPSNMRTHVTFSEPSKFFTRQKNIFLYFVSWCH